MNAQVIAMAEYQEERLPVNAGAVSSEVLMDGSGARAGMDAPELQTERQTAFVPLFQRPEVQEWMRHMMGYLMPPLIGFVVFLGVWSAVASGTDYLPGPQKTWVSAIELFKDPFYQKGPNDQGVGWNVYNSLKRVALGFGLAALIGIPMGFLLGRFVLLSRAFNPIISLLRPVSPLAWLPIGLAVFQAANPAAVFTIFVCSIWPMVINTAAGVASVPQDYLNVARVLKLSEWKVFTRILLPATVPFVLTGAKLALGIAWLVIVASEMLTGGTGIGFWVWDEWNSLNMEHIIIAIFIIGSVGLLLEVGMSRLAARFDYRGR